MIDTFSLCVAFILKIEGGLVHHPNDPGGLTKYGISQKSYPDLNIPIVTERDAVEIYRRDFWKVIRGDELPPPIALLIFDHAVNAGPKRAATILQAYYGATIDGHIGPETVEKVHAQFKPGDLLFLSERRLTYYDSLPGARAFGTGWRVRVLKTFKRALEMNFNADAGIDLETR